MLWLASTGLIATLCFGMFFSARAAREGWIEAVIVTDQTLSRSGPSEDYSELDLLSEGIRVRCFGAPTDGWMKIQLPQGRFGYAPEASIEII